MLNFIMINKNDRLSISKLQQRDKLASKSRQCEVCVCIHVQSLGIQTTKNCWNLH